MKTITLIFILTLGVFHFGRAQTDVIAEISFIEVAKKNKLKTISIKPKNLSRLFLYYELDTNGIIRHGYSGLNDSIVDRKKLHVIDSAQFYNRMDFLDSAYKYQENFASKFTWEFDSKRRLKKVTCYNKLTDLIEYYNLYVYNDVGLPISFTHYLRNESEYREFEFSYGYYE